MSTFDWRKPSETCAELAAAEVLRSGVTKNVKAHRKEMGQEKTLYGKTSATLRIRQRKLIKGAA